MSPRPCLATEVLVRGRGSALPGEPSPSAWNDLILTFGPLCWEFQRPGRCSLGPSGAVYSPFLFYSSASRALVAGPERVLQSE